MAASALLKINLVSIKECMAATTTEQKMKFSIFCSNVLSWNKETLHSGKNCSLPLNTVNYEENMFFSNNYFGLQSFFISCHFTKIFVHLLIISAVSNLNVFKLIGWELATTYLFKVKRNTRKRCEICSKLTIKTVNVALVSLFLTLSIHRTFFWCCYCSLWTMDEDALFKEADALFNTIQK